MNEAIVKLVLRNLGIDPEEVKKKGNELYEGAKIGLIKVNTFEAQLNKQTEILELVCKKLGIENKPTEARELPNGQSKEISPSGTLLN